MLVSVTACRNGIHQCSTVYDIDGVTCLGDALQQFQAQYPWLTDCILIAEEAQEATWVEAVYAPANDTTFIVEYQRNADGLISREEVVGFYHGEPDSQLTEKFRHLGVVAEF